MKVAIYDSGVGGLTILEALAERMPDSNYIFVSDNAAYPYGTKDEPELLSRCDLVTDTIVNRFRPDVLIIACNTASTVCLPSLRAKHRLPIVGVVPAIKPAAAQSISKVIGLLATPATVSRGYTQNLIKEFASDCSVVRVGSSELVDLAEEKLSGRPVDLGHVESILEPFLLHESLDTLVLACTHFPLLKSEIKAVFGKHNKTIRMVDSGMAIAKRVESLFSSHSVHLTERLGELHDGHLAVFTRKVDRVDLLKNLKSFGLIRIEAISI